MTEIQLNQEELSILTRLISRATRNAISGIARMVNRDVEVKTLYMRRIPAQKVTSYLQNDGRLPDKWSDLGPKYNQ